jgi:hypothetical protein
MSRTAGQIQEYRDNSEPQGESPEEEERLEMRCRICDSDGRMDPRNRQTNKLLSATTGRRVEQELNSGDSPPRAEGIVSLSLGRSPDLASQLCFPFGTVLIANPVISGNLLRGLTVAGPCGIHTHFPILPIPGAPKLSDLTIEGRT